MVHCKPLPREDSPLNNGIAHWDVAASKLLITRASALNSDKLGNIVAANYYHSSNSNKNTVNTGTLRMWLLLAMLYLLQLTLLL